MFDDYDDIDISFLYKSRKKQEVKSIEERIEKLQEQKNKVLKERRKYFLKLMAIQVLSTVLSAGAGVGIGTCVGHSPLIREDVTREAHTKTIFSSNGEKETNKQYEPFENEKSNIKYYSDWVQNGGKYYTCETTYDVTGLSLDEVEGFIKIKGFDQKPFGEPVAERIIVKDSVSDEEIKNGPHYEGVIYEVDSNDTVVTPQTDYEQKEDIMWALVAPTFVGAYASAFFKVIYDGEDIIYYCEKSSKFAKQIASEQEKLKKSKKDDEEPVKKLKR